MWGGENRRETEIKWERETCGETRRKETVIWGRRRFAEGR